MIQLKSIITCMLVSSTGLVLAQGGNDLRDIKGASPEELAMHKEVGEAVDRGRQFLRKNMFEDAIAAFREAIRIDREIEVRFGGFSSGSHYELAKALSMAGRPEESLAAYKSAYRWNNKRGDIESNGPPVVRMAMDYAMLLATIGKAEEAKAMYYFGLRHLNNGDRQKEPAPFLVVFDPEPEGVYWEYSPERLEAAALMAKAMQGGYTDGDGKSISTRDMIKRVEELAPDWFYPVLYRAARQGTGNDPRVLLPLAEGLAKPGIERELVAKYRDEEPTLGPYFRETGKLPPMKEGNERRARMQCLKPNETILKRLSVTIPAGN